MSNYTQKKRTRQGPRLLFNFYIEASVHRTVLKGMLKNLGIRSRRLVMLPWRSLGVSATTIAEGAVRLLVNLMYLPIDTTVGCHSDL